MRCESEYSIGAKPGLNGGALIGAFVLTCLPFISHLPACRVMLENQNIDDALSAVLLLSASILCFFGMPAQRSGFWSKLSRIGIICSAMLLGFMAVMATCELFCCPWKITQLAEDEKLRVVLLRQDLPCIRLAYLRCYSQIVPGIFGIELVRVNLTDSRNDCAVSTCSILGKDTLRVDFGGGQVRDLDLSKHGWFDGEDILKTSSDLTKSHS